MAAPRITTPRAKRKYSWIEAAFAVAQFLDCDPAFWIEQAGLAGIEAFAHEGRLAEMYVDGPDERAQFLSAWLSVSGQKSAVIELLTARQTLQAV